MPDLIADALRLRRRAAGGLARPASRSHPLYRAYFADGSTLDVHADVDAMADEVARVCGPAEAAGYRRYVDFVVAALPARDARLHRPQHRLAARRCSRPDLARLAALGGFRRLAPKVGALPAGPADAAGLLLPGDVRRALAVRRARALRGHRATWTRWPACSSRAAACTPCRARWPARPRSTASVSGTAPTVARVELARRPGRGRAHRRRRADRRATPWCSTPTCRSRTGTCSAGEPRCGRRLTLLAVVLPAAGRARRATYTRTAHHNIHFGQAWRGTFDEIIDAGRLMSRPVVPGDEPDRGPTRRSRRPASRSTTCCSRRRTSTRRHRLGAPTGPRYRDEVVRDARGARLRRLRRRHRGRAR